MRRGCGKVRHRDSISAKMAVARIRQRDESDRTALPVRVYPCRTCRGWHLTSKPLNGPRLTP